MPYFIINIVYFWTHGGFYHLDPEPGQVESNCMLVNSKYPLHSWVLVQKPATHSQINTNQLMNWWFDSSLLNFLDESQSISISMDDISQPSPYISIVIVSLLYISNLVSYQPITYFLWFPPPGRRTWLQRGGRTHFSHLQGPCCVDRQRDFWYRAGPVWQRDFFPWWTYIISYHIISYHITSYHIISYHTIYHIIPYHIISYLSLFCLPWRNGQSVSIIITWLDITPHIHGADMGLKNTRFPFYSSLIFFFQVHRFSWMVRSDPFWECKGRWMPTGGSEGTEDWECGNIVSLWKWEKPTLKPESGIP